MTKIDEIARETAGYYDVKLDKLLSRTSEEKEKKARKIAIYLSRKLTDLGLNDIGKYFDGLDHTTVLYFDKEIQKLIETDAKVAFEVNAIQQRINKT